MLKYKKPDPIDTIDLVAITRDAGKILTEVTLYREYITSVWLRFSQCRLSKSERQNHSIWQLDSYLLNATDFEHSAVYALWFELIGVQFDGIEYGQTRFSGWIGGNAEMFHVPNSDYNPTQHPETKDCGSKNCRRGEAHKILPDGFYVPASNPELFEKVRGCRVDIRTGPCE